MPLWGKQFSLVANTAGTNTNNFIFSLSSTANLFAGINVRGNNVPNSTFVLAIINSTAVSISANAAAASNGTYTFAAPPKWRVLATQNAKPRGNAAFGNVTPGAFVNNQVATVTSANQTEVSGTSTYRTSGWGLVKQGTGPVTALAITNVGASYANLATGFVGNGQSNAYFTLTTNATGNVTSVQLLTVNFTTGFVQNTVVAGRGFINATAISLTSNASNSIASFASNTTNGGTNYQVGDILFTSNGGVNAIAVVATIKPANGAVNTATLLLGGSGFDGTAAHAVRTSLTIGLFGIASATATPGGTAYNNTDIITFSGGSLNGNGTPTTNSTGGITSIAITAQGTFPNSTLTVVVTVANSTGGASGGSGATFVPVLANGSGANLTPTFGGGVGLVVTPTLGGRAGRKHFEPLVAMRTMTGASVFKP